MENKKGSKDGQTPKVADVDAALDYLNRETATVMTEINEKALVRKLDLTIVPLMCQYIIDHRCSNQKVSNGYQGACYNLQYLDKTLSMSTSFSSFRDAGRLIIMPI